MGAPRRPNHRSQSFNLKCFTDACSLQNLKTKKNHHKISPKSIQNLSKTLPKSSQSCPKPLPEPSHKTATQKNRIFATFFNFWRVQALPKSSQNHQKSPKSAEKSKSKKQMFFNTIFSRIFLALASENNAQIHVFSLLFRKRRFSENRAPVETKLLFFRFGASKKRPKIDAETRSKKGSQKYLPKIDFGFDFGLPNPPKIHQNPPKKRRKAKLVSRRYGNRAEVVARQRKSSFV